MQTKTTGLVVFLLLGLLIALTCAEAQPAKKVFRIGWLSASAAPRTNPAFTALVKGLRKLGYVEGENVIVEFRKADGQLDRLPGLAAEMVELPVDVMVAVGTEVVLRATQQATRTIPIVMLAVNYDPLAKGYIASLARPGGNTTGVFFMQQTLSSKRLELLKKTLPQLSRVFVLYDAQSADQLEPTEAAARSLGLQIKSLQLRNPPYDFDHAMTTAQQAHAEALVVLSSPVFFGQRNQVAAATVTYRLPAIFLFGYYAAAGGLMSYGASLPGMFEYAATYVDKILKGANPADLPVEQPNKFELVINQKTAKQIGVTIPPIVLYQADKVIQ
jgi:putative ABC transport system substrate-binding protein